VPDTAILRHLEEDVFDRLLAAHDGGRFHDRIHDGLVARAATGVVVLREPRAHFFAGGVGILIEQGFGRYDHAGCAETALCRAVGRHRCLNRVQIAGLANAFDGDDLRTVGYALERRDAGQRNLAVHHHRARTAVPVIARDFGAGQVHLLADDVRQHHFGIDDNCSINTIDIQKSLLHDTTS